MLTFILTALLVPAAVEVEVRTLDGQQFQGRLSQLNAKELVLDPAPPGSPLPVGKLARLSALKPVPPSKIRAAVLVQLVDGSQLAGMAYRVKQGAARLELAGGTSVELKSDLVAAVRFRDPSELTDKLADQWAEALRQKAAGDLIVVRNKGSLDHLEGVVGDVDDQSVAFTLDNQVVPVKRPKVEGLVYYHATGAELPAAVGEVTDVHGSRFQAKSIELIAGQLHIVTLAGLAIDRALDVVALVNFSVGKVKYLSDLEPESVKYAPYFAPQQELVALTEFHKPRRDIGLEQNPLKLDGKIFAKGLALHSRTQIAYRLPDKFRQFKATVGIDDSVRSGGQAHLEIKGDDKQLWEGEVSGSEAAQQLELDISGVKRLEILVDYGRDLDVADHVDFCEAQVTK